MPKKIDVIGNKYGRLTVLEWIKGKGWLCVCDCGNTKICSISHLKNGQNKSCGCLLAEVQAYDGLTNSCEYSSFSAMHKRCDGVLKSSYESYALKGIVVCPEWSNDAKGFKQFLSDLGPRPANTSLERIDVNGNYCKENCEWATLDIQCYNRSLFKNNTSGITGVSFDKFKNKWIARIHRNRVVYRLGDFDTKEEAIEARLVAELEIYPERKLSR